MQPTKPNALDCLSILNLFGTIQKDFTPDPANLWKLTLHISQQNALFCLNENIFNWKGGARLDLIEAVQTRKSIRSFKPDPVPQEVIRKILETASRSPSSVNTQPWEFAVVGGDTLNSIRQEILKKLLSGIAPDPDFPDQTYQGIFRQRQVDLAVQIFQLMGISREDKAKRAEWMQRGFRFFDAPVTIFIAIDENIDGPFALFDIGGVAHAIALVALDYNLGTCIQIQGVAYPDVVRRHISSPESKKLVICINIGYPDWEFPANKLVSRREPVECTTTWHGL